MQWRAASRGGKREKMKEMIAQEVLNALKAVDRRERLCFLQLLTTDHRIKIKRTQQLDAEIRKQEKKQMNGIKVSQACSCSS